MASESDVTEIYDKFKKAQFDLDFGEDITKQYFTDYFKNNDIEEGTIQAVYNSIAKQNNDYLTTKEFFNWQREQCTKRVIQDLISINTNPSPNEQKENDKEWSKSYSLKLDLYEDQNGNDNDQNATEEKKEDPKQDTTTKPSENNQQEDEWSKSYEIKFDLYQDDDKNEAKEQKDKDTEIIYADSPKQETKLTPDKIETKPQMKTQVSRDFAEYIDANAPRKSPTGTNIKFSNSPKSEHKEAQSSPLSIGIEKTNFSNSPRTPPSKSQKSINRLDKFLTDSSEDEEEEVDDMINDEIKEQKNFRCMECICYLMFLILFTGMAIFSNGSGDSNYTATTAIRRPIIDTALFIGWNGVSEKSFDEASTADDVYAFMRQILLPFLMSDVRSINNTNVLYVQNQHILLGGIRMRQIRQKPLQCEVFNDSDCYEQNKFDRNSVTFYSSMNSNENITYEYVDSAVLLDQRYQGKFESYPGGGYIQDLPLDLNESLDIVDMLQEFHWVDAATLCLIIDWTTYHPSKSLHTVARLVLEMPTSGTFATDEVKTWKFDRYAGETSGFVLFLIHIIFILFVFVVTGIFIVDIYRNYFNEEQKEKLKKKKKISFWNQWRIMDILNLIIFYITIGLFVHNETYQKTLIDIYQYRAPYQSFRRLQALSLLEQFSFAANGFLLWVKLFKYLSFHPKFKFLFFMLQRGLQDIVMFIVLLFVFYLAFALSGFIMFSSDVAEYRTYGLSVVSMNLFMLTEMNYADLVTSARLFGSVYYFSWLIWMTFILVNVFIAILIDSYAKTQVEIELDSANAIHFNVFEKGREYVKRLKFAQLMSRFDLIDQDGDDNVDVDEIAKAFELTREDAEKVMKKYDKDGNGVLDRKEFEKLKQKLIRDKMEGKPDYRALKEHDNLTEQVNDMKDLLDKMLQIDPVGKRALKARQGLKRKSTAGYLD